MKQVLIITSGNSKQEIDPAVRMQYVAQFCEAVEGRLDSVSVKFTTYQDLEISVIDGRVNFYDTYNQLDLAKVDFIHLKNWINDTQMSGMVAQFAKARQIKFYNSEVANAPARSKIAQMVVFADNDLPVPDTFFASKASLKNLMKLPDWPLKSIDFPLILKANDGAKGDDNHLIKTKEQALEILDQAAPDKEFILQAYQPNDGDYRLLYVGLNADPLVFLRKSTNADSHLNNTSKGGSGQLVPLKDISNDFLKIARHAAQLTAREIGGVDILVNKSNQKPYLLEVNQTPALATGFAHDQKIQKFVDLINQSFDAEAER